MQTTVVHDHILTSFEFISIVFYTVELAQFNAKELIRLLVAVGQIVHLKHQNRIWQVI
jgi:hypothetical protein